ncbi:hypothetical protein ACET3Z_003576 [Daucus carota]
MENAGQDVERNLPAASQTELTHQVTEPMGRDTPTILIEELEHMGVVMIKWQIAGLAVHVARDVLCVYPLDGARHSCKLLALSA